MWYRVRLSWDNPASQLGAYEVYQNAVNKANAAGGYSVFDQDGRILYTAPALVKTMSYKAKLLKKAGSHKKGQTIIVTRDKKKRWVMTDGTIVGAKSDMDLLTQIYDNTCKYDKLTAESWVNKEGFASSTPYLFWCNKYGQRVYIFKGKKGAWQLLKTYKCSTGSINYSDNCDQGVGFNWKIYNKDKAFRTANGGIQKWNMHYSSPGGNSIHKGSVGKPATHGCIGMAENSVKWVFDNIPINTRVIVF